MNDEPGGSRTADAVVAWLLYALQVVGELGLGMFWLMSVMMTDSCGSVIDEPRVCDGEYFATWFFAYAAVLAAGLLITPIGIIVAGRRGKRRWPWPVIVILVLVAATIGYGFAFTR